MQRCYERLNVGGILIISTPNQLVSSPDNILNWEFHEKEYSPYELFEILKMAGFVEIEIYGQQLTQLGKFRQDIRGELNTLHFNPFVKLGKWIQQTLRGRKFNALLPEKMEDFEIEKSVDIDTITAKGIAGPFVLIAVCKKS